MGKHVQDSELGELAYKDSITQEDTNIPLVSSTDLSDENHEVPSLINGQTFNEGVLSKIASTIQADEGENNTTIMTPSRVKRVMNNYGVGERAYIANSTGDSVKPCSFFRITSSENSEYPTYGAGISIMYSDKRAAEIYHSINESALYFRDFSEGAPTTPRKLTTEEDVLTLVNSLGLSNVFYEDKDASVNPSSYKNGITLSRTDNTTGWKSSTSSIITFKIANSRAFQIEASKETSEIRYRTVTGSNGWADWYIPGETGGGRIHRTART